MHLIDTVTWLFCHLSTLLTTTVRIAAAAAETSQPRGREDEVAVMVATQCIRSLDSSSLPSTDVLDVRQQPDVSARSLCHPWNARHFDGTKGVPKEV